MDRLDREFALSAYHPGAVEDHGALIAPYDVFTDHVLGFHREGETATDAACQGGNVSFAARRQ